MRIIIVIVVLVCHSVAVAQSPEEQAVIEEGLRLYRSEIASWLGTDVFFTKFPDRKSVIGGYFSYPDSTTTICVFVSRGERTSVVGTVSFDGTFDTETAVASAEARELTKREAEFWMLRQAAMKELLSSKIYESYRDMNPNFVPLIDELGKRAYVLAGPTQSGVVVFGNDYYLTFDDANRLTSQKKIHNSLIPFDLTNQPKNTVATMHTHLPMTGDLITATDICTLLLYGKYTGWKSHHVVGSRFVSTWDLTQNDLVSTPKSDWEKKVKGKK